MSSARMRGVRCVVVVSMAAIFAVVGFQRLSAPAHAANATVSIENFAFSPASISIQAGDTITWVNNDSVTHTATATDGSFDTGPIAPGASACVTFNNAGTINFVCAIHPSMTGSVTVQAVDDSGNNGGTDDGRSDNPIELPDAGSGTAIASSGSPALTELLAVAALFALGGVTLVYRTRRHAER